MGFDGKLTLHPDQVTSVHKAFMPSATEISDAKEISKLFESADAAGAMLFKGRMVDRPHLL